MGITVDGSAKVFVVVTRVAEQLAIAQVLDGEQLAVAVGESVVVGIDVELAFLNAQQLAFLTNRGVAERCQIEIACLIEEGGLLKQFAIG